MLIWFVIIISFKRFIAVSQKAAYYQLLGSQ